MILGMGNLGVDVIYDRAKAAKDTFVQSQKMISRVFR